MPTKNRKHNRKILKAIMRYGFIAASVGVFMCLGLFLSVYFGAWSYMPDRNELANIRQNKASIVYASGGEMLGKYYTTDRQPVEYHQMPNHLREALIATEDARFYQHSGFDIRSFFRVICRSIILGDKSSGGGSTLSQQLIKNLYGRSNHGILTIPVNKIREAILASRLEKVYDKQELITLYLNTVPFSDNTYGIESASFRFFGKPASELSVPEVATLVGSLKANHSYNPRLFPEKAQNRRNVVLYQMQKYGYLSGQELSKYSQAPLELDYRSFAHNTGTAPYFRNTVKKELQAWLKDYNQLHGTSYNLYNSGLIIETTLDYNMQVMAEEAMEEHMSDLQKLFDKNHNPYLLTSNSLSFRREVRQTNAYRKLRQEGLSDKEAFTKLKLKKSVELWDWSGKRVENISTLDSIAHYKRLLNTGMLSLDPQSGAIRVWVGGTNYEYFKYDHVQQSKRQVGSTFKPIVYASAIEQGTSLCKFYSTNPVVYKNYNNWSTGNENLRPGKLYSMKGALANSLNTVSVKVMRDAGIENTVNLASSMGIKGLSNYPSIALGTAELSMINLAKAYTAFLNEGRVATPFFITKIKDHKGRVLGNFRPARSERVISEYTQQVTLDMLKSVVNKGTAGRLRWKYKLTNDMAGKTGTTQKNKDGWFIAMTPRLLSLTWVGNDYHPLSFKSTRLGQGANTALPVFAKFLQKLNSEEEYNYITQAKFPELPEDILALSGCPLEKDFGTQNNDLNRGLHNSRLMSLRHETEQMLKENLPGKRKVISASKETETDVTSLGLLSNRN